MPPVKGSLWKFYSRGPKQNTAHYRAYCLFCVRHHLGPTHPMNSPGATILPDDHPDLAAARELAGWVLGKKEAMIAHFVGNTLCPYASTDAKKLAKEVKSGTQAVEDDSDASDNGHVGKKRKKIFREVEKTMKQPELKVYRGASIPFTADELARVEVQFLRATVSANLPFRWSEDPEVIKLFLMFRATACDVIPSREVLLDVVEKGLQKALKDEWVVLSTDGWKDDSSNSIDGVNVSTKNQSLLVDLMKPNGHRKDGESMCAMFEGMIDTTESKYGCIVVLFCCDNDGGSQRGRKDLGLKRPRLFQVPCCAHQGQLILGDYFTANGEAATFAATELIGWIKSHDRVRFIFDTAQYQKNFAVLVYLVANLTRWTTHYLALRRLLVLKAPLRHAAYLQRSEIIAAHVGVEKNKKAKIKMTATATSFCDRIESNEFWAGLEMVVEDIEPICYATNINQADRRRGDQVLLTFAGLFRHFRAHSKPAVSQAMCSRIEKRWAALDQPLVVFCLILNPHEGLTRFGDKAGLNVFVLNRECMELYRRVFSRPSLRVSTAAKKPSPGAMWVIHDPILVWNQFKFCPDVVELAEFSIILLGLVMNQASNERTFPDLKIKKTRLHNRLGIPKLEKMSKLGSSIRTDHLESGLAEARKQRDVHSKEKAATLLTVPRYADTIEGSDNEHDDPETQRQPKVIKSAAAWRMELAKWKAAAASDDSDDDLVPPPQGRQSNLFPRSLALLFGGDVRRPVERPRAAQFTREVLLMELLAAEESDEEPDDGAMSGSEEEYSP
ncbi:ribonuclease H-like domain-containing protein [Mycena albidolilacea]|uniref:Ribonuclease H-like domain-containing protein n=1 Tax=Mycena albidolilacea TaxID=1033008 RepID=A0AAD6ZUC6_9AGAR|nr:ribonuclease H-like domain-containing protein [Mycena albidolilacea]